MNFEMSSEEKGLINNKVWFGYLIPNHLYTYILSIYDL